MTIRHGRVADTFPQNSGVCLSGDRHLLSTCNASNLPSSAHECRSMAMRTFKTLIDGRRDRKQTMSGTAPRQRPAEECSLSPLSLISTPTGTCPVLPSGPSRSQCLIRPLGDVATVIAGKIGNTRRCFPPKGPSTRESCEGLSIRLNTCTPRCGGKGDIQNIHTPPSEVIVCWLRVTGRV